MVSIEAACCTLCSKALDLPYKTHQEGLTIVESKARNYRQYISEDLPSSGIAHVNECALGLKPL